MTHNAQVKHVLFSSGTAAMVDGLQNAAMNPRIPKIALG